MLISHSTRISLGLSFILLGSASAQDILEPSPGQPAAPSGPVSPPELPTDTPSTELPPLPELPSLPGDPGDVTPSPVTPTPVVPNPLNPAPTPPIGDPLIPGSDLIPSPATGPDPDTGAPPDPLLSGDETTEAPEILGEGPPEGEFEDQERRPTDSPLSNAPGMAFQSTRDRGEEEYAGWAFSISVIESYTSNLQIADTGGDATLYTSISPSITYRSAAAGEARYILASTWIPTWTTYHSGAEGDVLDHEIDASLTHEGDRLTWVFTSGYSKINEANRFSGTFSESTNFDAQFDAQYIFSDRTILNFTAEYEDKENDATTFGNSSIFTSSLGALWEIGPKLNLGPGIRYAHSDSESFGSSSSIALGAQARYLYSELTSFSAGLGVERSRIQGRGSRNRPTANLGFVYAPREVWEVRGDVRYETIPVTNQNGSAAVGGGVNQGDQLNGSASDGGQQLNASIGVSYQPSDYWTYSAALTRRTAPSLLSANESLVDTGISFSVRRRLSETSTLGLRLSSNWTKYSGQGALQPDGSFDQTPDQTYKRVSVNYRQREFFHEQLSFAAEVGYSDSSGGDNPFDQTTASLSLEYEF